MRKFLAAAVLVLATVATGLPAASAAPAERTPVMYSGMGTAWTNAARRPHGFTLGADFGLSRMSWSRWTNSGASGSGHLVACAGAMGPCAIFRAGVTLSEVKTHDGTRYFAAMKLTGKNRTTQRLVMRHGSWFLVTGGYRAQPGSRPA
jgi:hypothetical protein